MKRKVLLPHRLLGNIYVRELGRAYRNLDCETIYGPENLYESSYEPDMIHLNWPEDLYRGYGSGATEDRARRLIAALKSFKERGARIAWTVHNLKPHEAYDGDVDSRVYQQIIDTADIIHHHCDCSKNALAENYRIPSSVEQFVAPHGHYRSYKNDSTRSFARTKLGIGENAFVYLHFGAIRGYKGIKNVLKAFVKARRKGDVLLIAGRMLSSGGQGERLMLAYYKYFSRSLMLHIRTIESDDIQYYVKAADALVLGHIDGLNSGVAVLGMTFGRPVIGPRLGCIDSVLSMGTNLTYSVGDIGEFATQMEAVKDLCTDDICRQNRDVAATWHWERIATPILESMK